MKDLSIVGVKVRQDKEGRFSLNDLHKAAVAAGKASASQRPAEFLKSASVKGFVSTLDADATISASVKSTKGGKNQGTYAVELVAIRYAAWIDPSFEIKVYQSFQALAKGEIDKAIAIASRLRLKDEYLPMTDAIKEAKEIEGKEVKHYHFSNEADMINRILTGKSAKKYKQENDCDSLRDNLTPVELKCMESLQRANTSMIDMGEEYAERKDKLNKLYHRLWLDKLTQEHIRIDLIKPLQLETI